MVPGRELVQISETALTDRRSLLVVDNRGRCRSRIWRGFAALVTPRAAYRAAQEFRLVVLQAGRRLETLPAARRCVACKPFRLHGNRTFSPLRALQTFDPFNRLRPIDPLGPLESFWPIDAFWAIRTI